MAEKQKPEIFSRKDLKRAYESACRNLGKFLRSEVVQLPLRVLTSPAEINNRMMDTIGSATPRGRVNRGIRILKYPQKSEIYKLEEDKGVAEIFIVLGDPSTFSQDTEGVYRHIITHELIHAQAPFRSNLGDNAVLSSRDLYSILPIHYFFGFKAVSRPFDNRVNRFGEITVTRHLDEWITQYFELLLYGNEKQLDIALSDMKQAGKGIETHSIEGAQLFAQLFDRLNISYDEIWNHYSQSDIRGFIELLESRSVMLGRKIIRANSEKKHDDAIRSLAEIVQNIQSK